jgi:hypothetical protein
MEARESEDLDVLFVCMVLLLYFPYCCDVVFCLCCTMFSALVGPKRGAMYCNFHL